MSVNKFIDGRLKMVAGLTPGGGGTGSIIKVQLSSTKGNTISNVGITLNIKDKEYNSITDNDGVAIFNGVTEVGTMTVTAAAEEFPSQTFKIEFFGSYELIMADSDPYEDWLAAAGLNPASYEDIDELLEDEAAVRALMTKTAAIDILANYITGERLEKIINHRYAAKWINYREYAYSTLSANEIIKELMDASGMYGMYITAESKSRPLVPPMTSNTGSDGGVASASTEYSSDYMAYMAFNGVNSGSVGNCWNASESDKLGEAYIQYKFSIPTVVSRLMINTADFTSTRVRSFIIKASNTGNSNDWVDLLTVSDNTNGTNYYDILNNNSYLYYRLLIIDGAEPNTSALAIGEIQFYGYQLESLIPPMTSNTEPSGEVSASSYTNNYEPYKAFSLKSGDLYAPSVNTTCSDFYLQYDLQKEVNIKAIRIAINTQTANHSFTFGLNGYNNTTDSWVKLSSITVSVNGWHEYWLSVDNENQFSKIKLTIDESTAAYVGEQNVRMICVNNDFQIYGEPALWQPKGLIPVMTSNTTPYGEASASSCHSNSNIYTAFNGDNENSSWHSTAGAPQWLQYKFVQPTCAHKFLVITCPGGGFKGILQASNDGSTWEDLNKDLDFQEASTAYNVNINNDKYFIYYRIYIEKSYYVSSGNQFSVITTLQFYGRQLEALIPPMTSNTTPIGEANVSSIYNNTYDAWKAFDGDDSSYWATAEGISYPTYLEYEFNSPTCVKSFIVKASYFSNTARLKDFKIQAYNGNDWVDLYTGTYENKSYNFVANVDNNNSYSRYRLYALSSHETKVVQIATLQFYGVPDYESRTYIYDHGVEVMPVTVYAQSTSNTARKDIDQLYLDSTAVKSSNVNAYTTNSINTTNYVLEACVVGDTLKDYGAHMGLNSTVPYNYVSSGSIEVKSHTGTSSSIPYTYLDISNVNGTYYPILNSGSSSTGVGITTVDEWWLE